MLEVAEMESAYFQLYFAVSVVIGIRCDHKLNLIGSPATNQQSHTLYILYVIIHT